MRTGAAAVHEGFFHEAAFYGSDDELLAIVLPFLREGVEAGEPAVVTFAEKNSELTRRALGDATGVTFLPGADHYSRPAKTIKAYRELFSQHVAEGATQIRVVGDVPHPGTGFDWDMWARYEGVVNDAYADFPVWGMCPYDVRVTPEHVVADVKRSHPHIATVDGEHLTSERFLDPDEFLSTLANPPPDPLESTAPFAEAYVPSLAASRRIAADTATAAGLGAAEVNAFVVSVNEVVTNAQLHGRPPFRLRTWARPGRAVATVTDAGRGITDRRVGLVPQTGKAVGGLGLWIAHQLCTDVTMRLDPDGFTVQLAVGRRAAD